MLYSYKNQYPTELPDRIRLQNGLTRTNPLTFTEEEIQNAGYVAVQAPPDFNEDQMLTWNGTDWVVQDKDNILSIAERWKNVRTIRDGTIASFDWKISRYYSEVRLGLEPTDNISDIDNYIQALRDVTSQPDPANLTWPTFGKSSTDN